MGWNGSGSVIRDNGTNSGVDVWAKDSGAGTLITSTNHDNHDEDLADAIENCIAKDGQNSATANLPMGGFKHTNVAVAAAANQYARADQVQKSAFSFAGTSGTSTAYVLTLGIAPAAYTGGLTIVFQPHTDNGLNPTINVNSLGAANLYISTGAPPASTLKANVIYMAVHDGSSGFYVIGY